MIIRGARVALDGATTRRVDLEIRDGKILFCEQGPSARALDFSGLLLLPGLINAHDHLEFNLFPQLGRRVYRNASEWAEDIYRPRESPVKEHLSVPLAVRLMWGGIRNLLSGATTVVHHNPYETSIFGEGFPVRVVKDFAWAHSLAFSPDLGDSFRKAPVGAPFIVHAAEGTDDQARSEIRRLDELGVLAPHTVLVHAIGAGPDDLSLLLRRGASLIWCPRSNLSTYGATLSGSTLGCGIAIALGTDSSISASGDLIDEIRTAVLECGVSQELVYDMVTSRAARVLRLSRGEGFIREGGVADLIAVADDGQSPAEAIVNLKPEVVMTGGKIKLLSERMADSPLRGRGVGFHAIRLASGGQFLINVDVPQLYREATDAIGPDLRLAGRYVTVEHLA